MWYDAPAMNWNIALPLGKGDPGHRHISPLFALYHSNEITPADVVEIATQTDGTLKMADGRAFAHKAGEVFVVEG